MVDDVHGASYPRGDDGSAAYGVRIVRDITDEKRANEQQRLLLHELNHRVKNTLTVVQGLAHQTFKSSSVPPELLRSFEGRLGALAAAHNLLMTQTWEATPIVDAAEAALRPFQTPGRRISLDGPGLLLTPAATVTLTLALHELATNAAKYGALSKDGGTIEIQWATEADSLTLVWREHGGPPVVEPVKSGFGTRLLQRAIASDLGGTVALDFAPAGFVCRIVAPLTQTTAQFTTACWSLNGSRGNIRQCLRWVEVRPTEGAFHKRRREVLRRSSDLVSMSNPAQYTS